MKKRYQLTASDLTPQGYYAYSNSSFVVYEHRGEYYIDNIKVDTLKNAIKFFEDLAVDTIEPVC